MTIQLMIVEDDPMVMEVNSEFINKIEGFSIVAKAFTGKEALELAARKKLDLILLDFYLPDTDGLSLLKEWRNKELNVDIILITATGDPEHIQNIFRFGAIDYIVKPFRFERLKQSLEHYKIMLKSLNEKEKLNQKDIDSLKPNPSETAKVEHTEHPIDYPKGINQLTLKQIVQYLLHSPERTYSAEELAQEIGLARVTVRRYLEYLESIGTVSIQIEYGTIGRPVNRYQIRTKGS